jgi:phosphoserine phosphatase
MEKQQSTPNPNVLNVYDFDHTLYAGDCSLDFYIYCVRQHPALLRYLPSQVVHTLMFALKLEDRTTFKSHFFVFLRGLKNVDVDVANFWRRYQHKLKQWYLQTDYTQGMIISASPAFLLQPVLTVAGITKLIATEMDPKTGRITGKNCRGQEKVTRLQRAYPEVEVASAYGDSPADMPLLKLARHAYMVKGEQVTQLTD